MQRKLGADNAKRLKQRMMELQAAISLEEISHLPPTRLHELTDNRAGQFSVDLSQQFRLIFEPNHAPVPKLDDGGIDLAGVVSITIVEIVDYH